MAIIVREGNSINSGFCSGNNRVNMEQVQVLIKGTVQLYNGGGSVTLNEPLNSGAFSGSEGKGIARGDPDSKVIGTQRSFNVGIGLGPEPFKDESFPKVKCNKWKKNDCLCEPQNKSYGTCGSFNVIDKNSKIDAVGATINSGYGAGAGFNNFHSEIDGSYTCRGTEKSFNAASGKQIIINGARVNTGAFAGAKSSAT